MTITKRTFEEKQEAWYEYVMTYSDEEKREWKWCPTCGEIWPMGYFAYSKKKKRNPPFRCEYCQKELDANKELRRHKRNKSPRAKRKYLSQHVSGGMRRSLKTGKHGHHWESLVDYTLDDLIKHLESQFLPGMTWDNYGEWHIDHIIPVSVFNFDSYDHPDFRRCWALSNLRPMWAKDNFKKGARFTGVFQPSLKLAPCRESS